MNEQTGPVGAMARPFDESRGPVTTQARPVDEAAERAVELDDRPVIRARRGAQRSVRAANGTARDAVTGRAHHVDAPRAHALEATQQHPIHPAHVT